MKHLGRWDFFEKGDRVIPRFPTMVYTVGTVTDIVKDERGMEYCVVKWDDGIMSGAAYPHFDLELEEPGVMKIYALPWPDSPYFPK